MDGVYTAHSTDDESRHESLSKNVCIRAAAIDAVPH